ncbi:glycosyltransferase family 39 protein [Pontimicrobium sp. SW4]|uniref:Glycosyltransferase family 39 protein n=1 Tax=Pontimicrobium sp. SW4 TaxID=3153519 RepID=A0AAU7BPL0_9FLAO
MKKSDTFSLIKNFKFAILFVAGVFILASAFPFKLYDESIWSYIGWLWSNQGIPPYIGIVENKTPGIFMLFALANKFSVDTIFIVRTLGVLFSLGTTILVYEIGKRLVDKATGIISIYIFGLTYSWSLLDGFAFAQTEIFMIFFSTLAFYFLINKSNSFSYKWLILSGLSLGLAIMFKQIAITTALALVIVFLILNTNYTNRQRIKGIGFIGIGVLLSTLFSYSILYMFDVTFLEYINGAWKILLNSGSKIESVNTHFSNFIKVFFYSKFILFLPILVLFFMNKKICSKTMYLFLGTWFIFDFIGVNASGYYYGHQIKQLLPSLSLIIAIVVSFHINKYSANLKKYASHQSSLSILVLIIFLFPYKQLYVNANSLINYSTYNKVYINEASNWLKSNTDNDDFIYALGADQELIFILDQTQRKSSSKYFNSIFIKEDLQRNLVLNDIKQNSPKFILKHGSLKNVEEIYGLEFNMYMKSNYTFLKSFDDVEIYKIK